MVFFGVMIVNYGKVCTFHQGIDIRDKIGLLSNGSKQVVFFVRVKMAYVPETPCVLKLFYFIDDLNI